MTLNRSLHRWTLAAMLVATAALSVAPKALADQGWHRWKHVEHGSWHGYGRPAYHGGYRGSWGAPYGHVVLHQHYYGGPGPVFAGLVGGMILGAVIESHAHPVVVREESYPAPVVEQPRYYDPPPTGQQRDYEPPPSERPNDQAPPAIEPERDRNDQPQAQPAPVYRYEDGNGERWWDTLDEATDAARGTGGLHVIKIVNDKTNQLVQTLYWKHDHWVSDDGSDPR